MVFHIGQWGAKTCEWCSPLPNGDDMSESARKRCANRSKSTPAAKRSRSEGGEMRGEEEIRHSGARFRSKKVVTKTVTKIVMKIVTRFPILENWKKLAVYTCHRIKIESRYNFSYNFRYKSFLRNRAPVLPWLSMLS